MLPTGPEYMNHYVSIVKIMSVFMISAAFEEEKNSKSFATKNFFSRDIIWSSTGSRHFGFQSKVNGRPAPGSAGGAPAGPPPPSASQPDASLGWMNPLPCYVAHHARPVASKTSASFQTEVSTPVSSVLGLVALALARAARPILSSVA